MLERVDPELVGLSSVRLERITSWLHEQVEAERLCGASTLVARHGKVAYLEAAGLAQQGQARAFEEQSLVRIYSMTKPVTTVAAMMLYEQGCFQLDDPIAAYIPEFAHTPVWAGGDSLDNVTAQQQPITIRNIMTHTSGLTYGFMGANLVDRAYRKADLEFPGSAPDLAHWVARLTEIPLLCQPGTQWNYSVSTDVLGRLVEIWSGRPLAQFFSEEIFTPLAMNETGFHVAQENVDRFTALYVPQQGGGMSSIGTAGEVPQAERGGLKLQDSATDSHFLQPTGLYSGGGGLVSSLGDYARFCQMLLNRGELDGVRLLSRTTVEYMRTNQLPNNSDMAAMGQPVWSETAYDGIGFGLGFAVVLDPVKAHIITSPGEHHWGGAASTFFWLDPVEDLFCIFFTQLMPSSTYPIRRELRTRVYQSIVG